jgi:DNA polymerase III alpha subunit (gram-positive type)
MMSKPELIISIDIETDGPCTGLNSMLSLGAVAYWDGVQIDTFYSKLLPMDDAVQNSDTMIFWASQPEAWAEVNTDQEEPLLVMNEFGIWLTDLRDRNNAKLTAAAWPASFDFGFVNWYMHQYYGDNPLGFACLDIRSYANGLFHTPGYYEKISEGDLYEFFKIDKSDLRPHVALDDAMEQGRLLMALIKYASYLK